MDTLLSNFDISMSYDSQHYASNDSGLSSNSNCGLENDKTSTTSFVDFHCDDLTKSLFINSIEGNELIRDDDIYSYKYKVEIQNMFNNKFRSFNFPKSDNFKIKNSCTFSSIIQDLENLKESEPLCKYPVDIPLPNITMKDKPTNLQSKNQSNISIGKQNEDYLCDMKYELLDRIKTKKPFKKIRQPNNSNNIQEYVSSSIKNYKGNQSVNELVEFIQGTTNSKQHANKSKLDKITLSNTQKIDSNNSPKSIELSVSNDSGNSDQGSPVSKDITANNSITIDGDSGTQSHFVSLNNSDEDTTQTTFINDFQEVVPKSRKKQQKKPNKTDSNDNTTTSPVNNCTIKSKSLIKCSKSTKKSNNKLKIAKSAEIEVEERRVSVGKTCVDLLDSKDSLRKFLTDQFSLFMKLSIMVS